MLQPDILTVKGAKYNRRAIDDPGLVLDGSGKERTSFEGKLVDLIRASNSGQLSSALDSSGPAANSSNMAAMGKQSSLPSTSTSTSSSLNPPSSLLASSTSAPPHQLPHQVPPRLPVDLYRESDPYWKKPLSCQVEPHSDLVVIHVCDENQQISRDFCCNRTTLVENMRYFDRFLGENETGYEDIDISVHCDVEIFEWLMTYIHDPKHQSIKIDKSIIISILISSEFLQMDELVDICVEQVASNLNDIIRLPIDLSCVSEKLINRIAALTHPKVLCEVKDKKDKILTKLYKRRVELDFSRKGSGSKSSSQQTHRTIASSLTCCRYCGWVYLESHVTSLVCRQSQPSIDYRGRLTSRHAAIPSWSLTSYLKTLHSGGMGWDAIYWHVWAACVILRSEGLTLSALEADRYTVEPDGLLLRSCPVRTAGVENGLSPRLSPTGQPASTSSTSSAPAGGVSSSSSAAAAAAGPAGTALGGGPKLLGEETSSSSSPRSGLSVYAKALSAHLLPSSLDGSAGLSGTFSLGNPESANVETTARMSIAYRSADWMGSTTSTTPSLHPARPPDVLTSEIFDLLCAQMKFITGVPHRALLQQTMQQMVSSAARADHRHSRLPSGAIDFHEILWGGAHDQYGAVRDESVGPGGEGGGTPRGMGDERRRGRSPVRPLRASSLEPRRALSQGLHKTRSSGGLAAVGGSNSGTATATGAASGNGPGGGLPSDYDSDGNDVVAPGRKATSALSERRARSSSTGKRGTGGGTGSVPAMGAFKTGPSGNFPTTPSTTKKGALSKATDAVPLGVGLGETASDRGDADDDRSPQRDDYLARQMDILLSMPADLHYKTSQQRASVYGVWLTANPLTLHPPALDEMLALVSESSLSENKKIEWELDLMREYDERRMDRLERYLISTRAAGSLPPAAGGGMTSGGGAGQAGTAAGRHKAKTGKIKGDYYRDRGRQAFRCVT